MKGKSRYFILGAAIGAAAALAFTPQKGSEFRKTAAENTKKFIDNADEIIKEIKEKFSEIGEDEKILHPDEEILISRDYKSEVDEYER